MPQFPGLQRPCRSFWDAGDWGAGDPLTMRNKSNQFTCSRRAFTLVELMIVIVIIGAIAAFALPKYTQSVTLAKERRAGSNLLLIYNAQLNYLKYNNVYWPPAAGTQPLAQINANLALNIIADGDTYTCRHGAPPGTGYTCLAQFDNGAYELQITQAPLQANINPCCSAGACLTVSACP